MSSDDLCGACGAPGALRCGRCRSEVYCSAACQRAAWRTHKAACAPPSAAVVTPPRPWPPMPDPSWEPPYLAQMRALPPGVRHRAAAAYDFYARSLSARTRGEESPRLPTAAQLAAAIGAGADSVNICDGRGITLLHLAAFFDDAHLCDELIRAGADVSAWSLSTPAPLHVAALAGSLGAIRVLLRAGADANQGCAWMRRDYATECLMLPYTLGVGIGVDGADSALPSPPPPALVGAPLPPAGESPQPQPSDTMRLTLSVGGALSAAPQRPWAESVGDMLSWWYPLHWAALSTAPRGAAAARLLLDAGAAVSQPGAKHMSAWTALHLAAMTHRAATVAALLAAGADVHAASGNYGQAPLLAAVAWGFCGPMVRMNLGAGMEVWGGGFRVGSDADVGATCRALVDAGADPTCATRLSPLDEAWGGGAAGEGGEEGEGAPAVAAAPSVVARLARDRRAARRALAGELEAAWAARGGAPPAPVPPAAAAS